mmetsp:Transcript_23416/g.65765  ORF Transcript_23416/g.65765 Transcript_23416/m.65765 type:complete len:201 (-) Transcript_23416:1705-2307(-)
MPTVHEQEPLEVQYQVVWDRPKFESFPRLDVILASATIPHVIPTQFFLTPKVLQAVLDGEDFLLLHRFVHCYRPRRGLVEDSEESFVLPFDGQARPPFKGKERRRGVQQMPITFLHTHAFRTVEPRSIDPLKEKGEFLKLPDTLDRPGRRTISYSSVFRRPLSVLLPLLTHPCVPFNGFLQKPLHVFPYIFIQFADVRCI